MQGIELVVQMSNEGPQGGEREVSQQQSWVLSSLAGSPPPKGIMPVPIYLQGKGGQGDKSQEYNHWT